KPDLVAVSTNFNDPVNVLLNAGDGTFQGAQAYDVGPGSGPGLRSVAIASFNGDKTPDLAVTNFTAGDVSILLNNGNGTFQPQRRFNAAPQDDALAAVDVNGDTFTDLVVLQHDPSDKGATLAVLLGRGDGTFRPPEKLVTTFTEGAGIVLAGDLNHDGRQDLVVFSFNSPVIDIFYGNGDGTFQPVQTIQAAENVASAKLVDLNGDGVPDIITTGTVDSIISVLINNGDGTFQAPQTFAVTPDKSGIATAIADIAVGDFGSGHEDVAAIVKPRNGTALPQLVVLQELLDKNGHFAGYGAAQSIAVDPFLGPLLATDLDGSGALDLIAAVPGGVMVFYGNPPALTPNETPQTARDLGVITHQVVPTLSIVPTHENSFFKLTVPTEAVANAGPEVIDFSGLFRFVNDGGLSMEVTDAAGNVLGSGARFQVIAAQGEVLTLHVFGVGTSPGARGVGAYTLDIDVLPQFVGVQAEALLPGQFGGPGGPTTSLVITLQGDRLDPRVAETAANYHVFSLGQDGVTAPGAVQEIPLNTTSGVQSVVYNPGANVDVTTGITYATAERQTITLLFTQPLPAGSYAIQFDPAIQAAPLSDSESVLLAPAANLAGHPLVAVVDGNVSAGPTPVVHALVPASGALGSFDGFPTGTQFLTQLHDDLGRVLDSGLNQLGDAQSVTTQVLQQIAARFDPSLGTPGQRPASMLVLWLDPVSLDLADPAGKRAIYDLKTNTVSNQQSRTFVEVGGNIEVFVLADVVGTFHLNVADVPPTARGGALVFSQAGDQTFAFTNQLRDGIDSFIIDIAKEVVTIPVPPGGMPPVPKPGNPPDTPTQPNAQTAALLIGITTAPIVPTNLRVEASTNAGALGESLGSIIGALSNAVGAAAGSGAGGSVATVEQFFRDFTNGVGDRLNMLANEVGNSGQLLAESGLRAVQAPAQAILSALEAVGMPDISLPTVPLQEIGSEILRAIIPSVKAVGGAARKMPNGQKIQNPSTGTQTPPKQQTVPMPEDDELMPDEDEVPAAPPLDQAQEQDALLATAVLLAGLCYGSNRDSEDADDSDNDRRRSPRLKR
ncbi:MAG TPA: VCBS repeat-containing protein, partial [Gemmataceae bacterium]|nr:VCBS repeat-containing protein [Gemmataceae bacterium]